MLYTSFKSNKGRTVTCKVVFTLVLNQNVIPTIIFFDLFATMILQNFTGFMNGMEGRGGFVDKFNKVLS